MTPDGVLVVDKPVGPTSHDVVAVARRALRTSRIGHTGTLDPLASGVLVLVIGAATRLARFMARDTKRYEARVTFGATTRTYDAAGDVTSRSGLAPAREALAAELERRLGPQLQHPPAFSAKKVGGEVAHRAARADRPLALAPSPVVIHRITLLAYEDGTAVLDLEVSAGFYVRSFAHDLGLALGTGAFLAGLRRTASGSFTLAQAVGVDRLVTDPNAAREAIQGLERMLPDLPATPLAPEAVSRIRHGQAVPLPAGLVVPVGAAVRLLDPAGRLVAMGELRQGAGPVLQPVVVVG